VFVLNCNVPLLCVIDVAAYVAYAMGAGVSPNRDAVGVPQVVAKAVGPAGQLAPLKVVVTGVRVLFHTARVTSVQAAEPGVLAVPAAQAMHTAAVVAEEPPSEKVLAPHGLVVPAPCPAAHQ
jgi:hypothetical protein